MSIETIKVEKYEEIYLKEIRNIYKTGRKTPMPSKSIN